MAADLGTADERAFALAHEGATLLDRYRERQDPALLQLAVEHLREALTRDPGFTFALLTYGVALEYFGDHYGAIDHFTRLRERHPDYEPDDVTYNLATSNLCTYTPEGYLRAESLFRSLAEPAKQVEMQALARASLATVYAQQLVDVVRSQGPDAEVERLRGLALEHSTAGESLANQCDPGDWRVRETSWLLHNARGLTLLYVTRYRLRREGWSTEIESRFSQAEVAFEGALRYSPGNLDVLSNLGTLWLDRWKGQPREEFLRRSRELWLAVIKGRPNIDFGYYRLGQVERWMARFTQSIDALRRALEAPSHEVEQDQIRAELRLAEAGDASAP